MKQALIDRLTTYVKIDTQSNSNNSSCPSSEGQWDLAKQLADELTAIGLQEVSLNENCYVMATLPANTDKQVETIGFLAHLDTATDFTGKNVKPQLVENYDGGNIVLNHEQEIILKPSEYPALKNYQGQTLMTTDGTTLLGADNKAGIAEIMTAMAFLIEHPEIKHGKIRVAFTPDEEIGRGPHKFDVDAFGAQYAYTIDGGPLGELQYESFNAAAARVCFQGNNVHPGTAKNKMVNSIKLAMAFQDRLPAEQAPEFTEKYEGFYHLLSFRGDTEASTLAYIIRDHDREKFEAKKERLKKLTLEFKQKYGDKAVTLELSDQYYNMRDKIEPVSHIVDIAAEAMKSLAIKPIIDPIRGGTDGSQLSYMGLPTPNIFTGGENFHGKFEFISIDHMEKAVQTIVRIAEQFVNRAE
ncbi:tripeptide aminopeptidase [Amphibacillus marinus]|uniref:Peptidase T n=1 Tax=Amphibacillus marinus TaxID=872970 RepID=A0A1H8K2Z5_9BACI|nr:peptidase T [Amphibacillus marinus]SEN87304.1 tripeptide aminopeptidase [Amphibacillus marinus]